jgi:hypothetical protein
MNIEITDECVDMLVVATLKQSYHLDWDPYDTPRGEDLEYRKAIDTVLKYFMTQPDYNEWLESNKEKIDHDYY